MQHLDEAALQAWLDGARSGLDPSKLEAIERHVATCDACAMRADALERSSFRTHALLSVGRDRYAPRLPYETVVQRARGSQPRPRPLMRRLRTTWAASIVAALAVGWVSNELVPSPAPADATSTGEALAAAGRERRSGAVQAVSVTQAPLAGSGTRSGTAQRTEPGLVVQGFVEDESGRPVASAQVYVAALDIGVLTQPDGRYALRLDAEPTPFEITVERIGFRQQTRSIDPGEGDFVAADFRLREEALALDEIVVVGESEGGPIRAIAPDVRSRSFAWRPAPSIAAEGYVGSNLWTLPDVDIMTLDVAYGDNTNETHVARVRHDLGNGAILTLIQGRTDGRRANWPIQSEGSVLSTWRGGMLITATAPLPEDSLRTLLERLR